MKSYRSLSLLLLASIAAPGAFAVDVPLVYGVENTGAAYAAPSFPEYDWLPIVRPLPDPFRYADGTRDESFAAWAHHRSDIKASIEKYEIGWKPDASDLVTTATYIPPGAVGSYGPNAGKLTVVTTRPSNGKTVTQTVKVWLPPSFPGMAKYPALIALRNGTTSSGGSASYASLGSRVLGVRPIATVDFNHNAVTNYSGGTDKSNDPFYQMYPEFIGAGHQTDGAYDSTSGQYAAWSWGVSRLIDGMEIAAADPVNPLPIDLSHLAVSGCSYAGKMALFAGAFDERIALTVAQENGGGGSPAWRISQEIEGNREVESLTNTDHKWFASQMFQFSQNNVYKLPHDHHELNAMVAPRALLETGNTNYNWLSNKSNYASSKATQRIYETLGIGDRFGFIIDGGHGHCSLPTTQDAPLAAYVDKFLLGDMTTDTAVRVHPFGDDFDYARWTAWWGTNNPTLSDWNPGNGKVVQYVNRPVDVLGGSNVQAGLAISQPFDHPEANVKIVGGSVQLDVYNPDGRCYTLTVPFANDLAYVIPENFAGWLPSPNQKSALTYQGSATAGIGGSIKNIVFSAVGVNLGGAGNLAGPGVFADTGDPVDVRWHVNTGTGGANGSWSPTVTVVNE